MRSLAALLLVFGPMASLAGAQTPAEALRSPMKRIAAADLPETYRAVALQPGEMGTMGFYALAGIGGGGSEQDGASRLLFGLIGTMFVDPDEFAELLDGKRPRVRGFALDFMSTMMEAPRGEGSRAPAPVFIETWIEGGRIVQWSPRPAVTREAILKAFPKRNDPSVSLPRSQGLSNAKEVAIGIIHYLVDNDDKYPAAHSTLEAQSVVMPYLKSASVWASANPAGGRLIYNVTLSRVSQTSIQSPAETLLLWDEKPWPDGTRIAAFADGHVKVIPKEGWPALWAGEEQRRKASKALPGTLRPAIVPAPAAKAGRKVP